MKKCNSFAAIVDYKQCSVLSSTIAELPMPVDVSQVDIGKPV